MNAVFSAPGAELTQDEKAFAGLAHALMTCTWWIGPLIIYLTKKESRFVSFHALQALFWQLIVTVLYIGVMVASMISVIASVTSQQPSSAGPQFPAALFIVISVMMWLFILGMAAVTLILAILYCLKAMRGEWAGYPVIGNWVRQIVKD